MGEVRERWKFDFKGEKDKGGNNGGEVKKEM